MSKVISNNLSSIKGIQMNNNKDQLCLWDLLISVASLKHGLLQVYRISLLKGTGQQKDIKVWRSVGAENVAQGHWQGQDVPPTSLTWQEKTKKLSGGCLEAYGEAVSSILAPI